MARRVAGAVGNGVFFDGGDCLTSVKEWVVLLGNFTIWVGWSLSFGGFWGDHIGVDFA